MTDDELRERLDEVRQYGFGWVAITTDDFGRLLDRLPPADDGEPVTADWLRAVGFVKWGDRGSMIRFHRTWQPDHDDSIEVNAAHQWAEIEHGFDVVRVPNISTRGHVRRLCAALGITLTESDRDRQST